MWNLLDQTSHLCTVIHHFISWEFHTQSRVFDQAWSFWFFFLSRPSIENLVQYQKSRAWIKDRLSCTFYWSTTGLPIFKFKNYLVRYIHSIDPNFQENGVHNALYCEYGAMIFANTPEAASEIKRLLHDRNTSDVFPGIEHLEKFIFYTEI